MEKEDDLETKEILDVTISVLLIILGFSLILNRGYTFFGGVAGLVVTLILKKK